MVCLLTLFSSVLLNQLPLQKFVRPTSKVEKWAVANFSARCDVQVVVRDLIRIADMKGIVSSIAV